MDNNHVPTIVPDKQMMDFIAVAGTLNEHIMYVDPLEIHLKKGERVRVNGRNLGRCGWQVCEN